MGAPSAWFPFASDLGEAYLPPMFAMRLMRILAIFAILLAPVRMMGPAAMAHPPQAPASASHHGQSAEEGSHCAEIRGEGEDSDGSDPQQDCLSDCAVTCAAISVLDAPLPEPDPLLAVGHPAPLLNWMHGLTPEAADPPPRTA